MTHGIIVARDGYTVETATVLQQVFNSGLNTLKIFSSGSFSSSANGARTVNVAHTLDYAPCYLTYFTVTGIDKWYADHSAEPESGSLCSVTTMSDDTNVIFYLTSTTTKNITVKYFIMIDPGESV